MTSASNSITLKPSNNASGTYTLTASFVENSTSTANNTSNITLTATITGNGVGYAGASQNTWDIYWIDDNNNQNPLLVKSESITSLTKNTSKSISATIDVGHKGDGYLNGRIQVNYNNHGTGYSPKSGSVTTDMTGLTQIPRYAVISNFNATTTDETSALISFSVDSTIDYCQYRFGTPYTQYWGNWVDTGVSADSRQFSIGSLTANTLYQIQIRVKRADSQLWTESNAKIFLTYDYPKVISTTWFNIGENPTFNVDNPLRRNITINFKKSSNNSTYFSFIGNMNGNYTPEMNDNVSQETLYNITNSTTNNEEYYLTVVYGSSTKTFVGGSKFGAGQNCKPIVTASIEDVNQTTLNLTNDSSQIISKFSTARVTPTLIKLTDVNDLNTTLLGYIINNSTINTSPYYKDIVNATSVSYPVVAINSRGFRSTQVNSTGATLHPYIDVTAVADFDRPSQTGTTMQVNFSGNYYNGYFDTTNNDNHNTLTLKWYVRVSEEDNWTLGGTFVENTDYTITNNTYESDGNVLITCPQTITSGAWDYMTKYYFKFEASDLLQSISYQEYVKIGQPYFDWWTENGVNYFNVNGEILKNNVAIPIIDVKTSYNTSTTDPYACSYINNNIGTVDTNDYLIPAKQIKLDNGYRTKHDAGYEIDAYGNFRHLNSNNTGWFSLNDYNNNYKFKYYWETGELELDGQKILRPYTIYESQGTSTSFSLSQNTNDYQYLEIYYATNDANSMSCRKVKVNTNGTTMASLDYWYTLSGTMYFKQANVDISGTSVTFKNNSQCGLGVAYSDGSYIYILRIVGYK